MPRKPSTKAIVRKNPGITKPVVERATTADFITSTVRPGDEYNQFQKQQTHAALVSRHGGDVKVLANGNGAGVASVPLRVMHARRRGQKSAWETIGIPKKRRKWMETGAGEMCRKSMARVQDEVEEIVDPLHPAVRLLTDANDRDDQFSLIERTEIALGLTGNAYWMLAYDEDEQGNRTSEFPTQLWPLAPQCVRVIPDRETFIAGYTYGAGYEVEQTYKPADIVHFRRPSMRNDYYGEGDLQAVLIQADISFDLACFWKATLDNACQPGLVITGEGVTDLTRNQLQEAVDRRYRGVRKAAVTAILSGDIKVEQWALKEADFSHITGSDQVTKMLCRAFDTPVEKLEMRPGGLSNGQNAVTQQWQRWALLPRCRRMENTLNAKLAPILRAALNDPTLFFAFDNPVDEDEAALVDRAVRLFTANLYDRDRALGMLGEDAVDNKPVYAIDLTTQGAITQAEASAALQPKPDEEPIDAEATVTEDAPALPSGGSDVQATALNGAQVTALTDLVGRVALGELPLAAVKPMMLISYPNTPEAQIDALIGALTGFEAPKPEPVVPFGGGNQPGGGPPKEPDEGGGGGTPPTKARTAEPAETDAPPAAAPSVRIDITHAKSEPGNKHRACCGTGYADLFAPTEPQDEFKDDDYRRKFQAAIEQWFSGVADPAIKAAVAEFIESGMTTQIANVLSSDPEMLAGFQKVVQPFTEQAMMNGNGVAMQSLNGMGRAGDAEYWVDVPPKAAIEWSRNNSVRLAESTLETIDARVRDTVGGALGEATALGLEEGQKIAEIQNRVAEVMGPTSSRYAAERIARTESAKALGMGRLETYKESGEVWGTEWLASADPCPICVDLVGKKVPLGQPFMVTDYGPVYCAPAHPQCGCDTTAVFNEEVQVSS